MHKFSAVKLDAIVFDCDGTLSKLEGIDELARMNGKGPEVERITQRAMNDTGVNEDIYAQRLAMIKPTYLQLLRLGERYIEHLSPDASKTFEILRSLGKTIYIISGGMYLPVKILAEFLKVHEARVHAVNLSFDDAGHYIDFDHHSALVHPGGKRVVLETIKQQHNHVAHIGDGMNDYVVHDIVTRFIGYGGAFYRQKVAKLAKFYTKEASLLSVLPFCLTEQEFQRVDCL